MGIKVHYEVLSVGSHIHIYTHTQTIWGTNICMERSLAHCLWTQTSATLQSVGLLDIVHFVVSYFNAVSNVTSFPLYSIAGFRLFSHQFFVFCRIRPKHTKKLPHIHMYVVALHKHSDAFFHFHNILFSQNLTFLLLLNFNEMLRLLFLSIYTFDYGYCMRVLNF